MDIKEVRAEFFQSTRRVRYVREKALHDTEEQGRSRFERKVFTYVVGASNRHILRRWK